VRIHAFLTAGVLLAALAPADAAETMGPRWTVSPRAALWRTDAAMAEDATLTPHLGAEVGWLTTPRTRLALRGGWSHLEAASTGRDGELGTLSAGLVADLRGHGKVRPTVGLSLGYAEDWTTDAPGALAHAMATLEAGVEIAPGLRFGLEQALFFGNSSPLHGTFFQVGYQVPLANFKRAKKAQVDAAAADEDADGVANAKDECAGTAAGTQVDARGCPTDADRDGVADAGDMCAATPTGARVDPRGCPTDADADGVLDGLDQCPASPPRTRVDARGCARSPLADALVGGRAVLARLRFKPGTTELLPGGDPTLAEIGTLLLASPELSMEIAVFTDARGDAGRNRVLAQQRADRVVALVRGRVPGLAAGRLLARGYGEDTPLAAEDTAPSAWRGDRVEARVRPNAGAH